MDAIGEPPDPPAKKSRLPHPTPRASPSSLRRQRRSKESTGNEGAARTPPIHNIDPLRAENGSSVGRTPDGGHGTGRTPSGGHGQAKSRRRAGESERDERDMAAGSFFLFFTRLGFSRRGERERKKRKFCENTLQFPGFRAQSFFPLFVSYVLNFVGCEGPKRNILNREKNREDV